ncbi:MAG: flavodoxin family protein [Brevefilum sp.]
MPKVFVINGSPNQARGNTGMILEPFLEGLKENDAAVELFYASQLKVHPCACGKIICWNKTPGECVYKDSMQMVYPLLWNTDILVLATPVYIPLPGDMQNFINRLCPLLDPVLSFHGGRTQARLRKDVHLKSVVLLAVGGWWEAENLDVLIQIVQEFALKAGLDFTGALVRPHAHLMRRQGQITDQGQVVLQAVKAAAGELIREGKIREETLATIRQPLITFDEADVRYYSH